MFIEQCVPGREVVAVVFPKVRGNELGYVLKYRDEMGPDEVEFVEGAPADETGVETSTGVVDDAVVKKGRGKK